MRSFLNVATSLVSTVLVVGPFLISMPAGAATVNVNFVNTGVVVGGSTIFRADLAPTGLTTVASVRIQDSNSGVGGAGGIFAFSGFDLDALFLDADGNMATAGDRTFASSFLFTAGTTRPTFGDFTLQPNGAHPGPVFGSLNGTTIDHATATLSVLDGISNANVNFANGF